MKLDIWASKYQHDKKYVICDSYNNVDTLIKKQSSLINNLEAIRIKDIAKNVLIKNNAKSGIIKDIDIISSDMQIILLNNLIRDKGYNFIPKESLCTSTLSEILNTMNIIRSANVINDKELENINKIINDYEEVLKNNNYYDDILLLKDAIEILNNNQYDNYEYAILDYVKDKLSYLQVCFLESLNKEIEVIEIKDNNHNENYEFLSVYGEYNCIEKIIKDIVDKNINLSDVDIILANSSYETSIRAAFDSRLIPYSYTSNYSRHDHKEIEFITSVLNWIMDEFSYSTFKNIINNKSLEFVDEAVISDDSNYNISAYQLGIDANMSYGLDRFLKYVEDLNNRDYINKIYQSNPHYQESFIKEDALSKYVDFLNDLLNIFSEDVNNKPGLLLEKIVGFYEDHDVEDNDVLDYSEIINILKMMKDTESLKETIIAILERIDIPKNDLLRNDAVQIRTLNNVRILERPNVYILGMNYDDFEPKLRDNPIVSDGVLKNALDNKYYIAYALDASKNKKEVLMNTLSTFSGNKVTFIMSNYNTSEFRKSIPSPIFNELKKNKEVINCEGKYDNIIYLDDKDRIVLEDVNADIKVDFVEKKEINGKVVYKLKNPLTASNLNTIMKCPLQYIYSLKYFPKEYEERNEWTWLNNIEKGNLFHNVFEKYCGKIINVDSNNLSEDIYLDEFNKIFNDQIEYCQEIIPITNEKTFEIEKDEYYNQMKRYLQLMHKEFKEKHIHVINVESEFDQDKIKNKYLEIDETGHSASEDSTSKLVIRFKGNTRVDREDLLENDNEIRIVDYKTRKEKYDNSKMKENLQWFVYPYLEDAKSFEYHFPCDDASDVIEAVVKKDCFKELPEYAGKKLYDFFVKGIIEVLESDDDEKTCDYCDFRNICLKRLGIRRGDDNDK